MSTVLYQGKRVPLIESMVGVGKYTFGLCHDDDKKSYTIYKIAPGFVTPKLRCRVSERIRMELALDEEKKLIAIYTDLDGNLILKKPVPMKFLEEVSDDDKEKS